MRVLMYVSLDVETFNKAMREGTAGQKIGKIMEALKPEAAYFLDRDGQRAGVLVFDLPDASKIPEVTEPWMLAFNAKIEMHPVMVPADLQRSGIDELGKKWG